MDFFKGWWMLLQIVGGFLFFFGMLIPVMLGLIGLG